MSITQFVTRKFITIFFQLLSFPLIIAVELLNNVYHWYYADSYVPDIKKKAVLITGCDSGFGQNAAMYFASKGVNVFAGCLTTNGVAALQQHDPNIRAFLMDITKEKYVLEAREFVENTCNAEHLTFWGVVSNAGIAHEAVTADWFTYEDFKRVIDVNLLGHILTVVTFLPMVKKSKGRIAVMASVAGFLPVPTLCPYTASKFGVRGFAATLGKDLEATGVSVSVIAPDYYPTNIIQSSGTDRIAKKWESLSEELKMEYPLEKARAQADAMKKGVDQAASKNSVEDVSEVYFDAVFNTKPRPTYFVGYNAPLYQLFSSFPDYISGFLLSKLAG